MILQEKKEILNKILLVGCLTIIRLPRVFGLDINVWVFILTLAPFWFIIINNHLPDIDLSVTSPIKYTRLFILSLLIIIISGGLLIIATIFVQAFLHKGAFGYQIFSFIILVTSITGFVSGIVKMSAQISFNKWILWIGVVFFIIVIASIFRASSQAPFLLLYIYQYITIILFCISSRIVLLDEKRDYFNYVYFGLMVYLFTNVILYFMGFVNQTEIYLKEFEAVMLSWIGINTTRIYFPLATGINPFGMIGGVGFVMSFAYLFRSLKNRIEIVKVYIFPLTSIILCGLIILTTDSRGAVLFSIITSLLVIFYGYFGSNAVFIFSLISQLSVFSFLLKIQGTANFLTPFIRKGSDVLSGRGVIWQAGINYLTDFEWIHLIGFGLSGQVKSGIVNEYNHLFHSYINSNSISLHHFGLQGIYDYGYIGIVIAYLLIILIGLNLIQKNYSNEMRIHNLPIIASLLFLVFAGSVSVIPTFYSRELFLLFPFIWISSGVE